MFQELLEIRAGFVETIERLEEQFRDEPILLAIYKPSQEEGLRRVDCAIIEEFKKMPNVHSNYDDTRDILYLTTRSPKTGENKILSNRILLRMDFDTNEVIGLTVFDYKAEGAKGGTTKDSDPWDIPEIPNSKIPIWPR